MLVLLALLAAAPAQPGPLMAVLEFRSKLKGDLRDQVDASYLTDVVRSAALKQVPGLRVITRENMLVLLQQAGKKAEECEGGCEVETGRLLGADLVITGDVLRFGTSFKLNLRLHETRDGQLLSGAQASGRSVDELDHSLQRAVRELLAPVRGWQREQVEENGEEGGVENGVAGGVVGGMVSPPPAKAKPPPPVAQSKPQPPPAAQSKPQPPPQVAQTQPGAPVAQAQPHALPPVEQQRPAPVEQVQSPMPEPAPQRSHGLGLYAGGALDPSGKTAGAQVALVINSGGAWSILAGAGISPHPAARLSIAARLYDSDSWSIAFEPRVLYAPFPGSAVVGGGAGLRTSLHAARSLDVVFSVAGEGYHGPDGSFFAPLIALGLEPHRDRPRRPAPRRGPAEPLEQRLARIGARGRRSDRRARPAVRDRRL